MKKTGRLTKLTPAVQQSIAQAVAVGVPLVTAAQHAGISKSTVLGWLQRGAGETDRPAHKLFADFLDAVTRAKATDEVRRLARLEQAGRGGAVVARKTTTYPDGRVVTTEEYAPPDWRADAFYLERAYPDRWGRRERMDLRVNIEKLASQVAQACGVTAEELLAEANQILKELDEHGTSHSENRRV